VNDHIRLRGVRAYGYHGVLPEERSTGQLFVIDVDLLVDLSTAAATDRLDDTVDYASIGQRIVRLVESDPCNLIETVAGRIAAAVLEWEQVESVTVTVHKPQAPVGVPFDDVAVTLTRSRG
jgi:dihydroneopterin aldolase